jgi:hypothetical protein
MSQCERMASLNVFDCLMFLFLKWNERLMHARHGRHDFPLGNLRCSNQLSGVCSDGQFRKCLLFISLSFLVAISRMLLVRDFGEDLKGGRGGAERTFTFLALGIEPECLLAKGRDSSEHSRHNGTATNSYELNRGARRHHTSTTKTHQ